ncbi:MAG: hypothetical protein ACREH9_06195, partial [Pseudomonadota bacterium]
MAFNKARALQEAEKSAAQGKLAQAIQQYLVITENDPRDLGLLNTAGDLAVRDRNIPEALRLFRRLAGAYAREGFTLKAIAIYRKITKLDPNTIEPRLKLAELYAEQGLGREALGLYAEALQSAERGNQTDQALDIMRRMVAADPENEAHRRRLAECCAAAGRRAEAARVYLEAAEAAGRRNDGDTASVLLAQAEELDESVRWLPATEALRAQLASEPAAERSPETLAPAPVSAAPPEPAVNVETLLAELEVEPQPAPEPEAARENEPPAVASPDVASVFAVPPATPEPVAAAFEEQFEPHPAPDQPGRRLSESPGAALAVSTPEFDLSGEWE